MGKVLVIDDEEAVCEALAELLQHMSHDVSIALSLKEGIEKTASDEFQVILLDVHMPDGSGLDLLPELKNLAYDPEVIIVTGYGTPKSAEFALKNGAWDYIEKKSSVQDIMVSVDQALQYRKEKHTSAPKNPVKRERIIGNSPKMRPCFDLLSQAAVSDANVLITGETGTGKELFARAVHSNSPRAGKRARQSDTPASNPRADKSFVVVDCTALPETLVESVLFGHEKGAFTGAEKAQGGLVEQADGGTLFLDEVGELPLSVQKTFLRVLQERQFRPVGSSREKSSNFRLVAATNRNLDEMQKQGEFRKDLLFRIRALSIELPPLRERPEDIKALVRHHTARLCGSYGMEPKGFSPELLDALLAYRWPGNVRELVNTIDGMLAVAGSDATLFSKHLPLHIRVKIICNSFRDNKEKNQGNSTPSTQDPLISFKEHRRCSEKNYLQNLMNQTAGKIKDACSISGISRSRLYELLSKHEIKAT